MFSQNPVENNAPHSSFPLFACKKFSWFSFDELMLINGGHTFINPN